MFRLLLFISLLLCVISSCSIQKRVYRKGFYVEWKNRQKSDKATITSAKPEPDTNLVFVSIILPLESNSVSKNIKEESPVCVKDVEPALEQCALINRKYKPITNFRIPKVIPPFHKKVSSDNYIKKAGSGSHRDIGLVFLKFLLIAVLIAAFPIVLFISLYYGAYYIFALYIIFIVLILLVLLRTRRISKWKR